MVLKYRPIPINISNIVLGFEVPIQY